MEKTQQKKVQLPEEQKQWQKQKYRPQGLLFCPCWTLQFRTQFDSINRYCNSLLCPVPNHCTSCWVRFCIGGGSSKIGQRKLLRKKCRQKTATKKGVLWWRKNKFVRDCYILKGGIFRSKIPSLIIALRVLNDTYRTAIRKMPPTYGRPHSTPPSLSVSLYIVLCLF